MGFLEKLPGWTADSKGKRWTARALWVFAGLVLVSAIFGGGEQPDEVGDEPSADLQADTTGEVDDSGSQDVGATQDEGSESSSDQDDGGAEAPPETTPPEPIGFSGSGDAVTDPFTTENWLTRFEMSHDGSGNFIVWILDDQGNQVELAANKIGSYDGSRFFSLVPGEYVLDIQADGSWDVTITQPEPTEGEAVPASLSGQGDTASDALQLESGLTTFAMSHDGSGNFIVWLYDAEGNQIELLANEIGSYDGEKAVGIPEPGFYYLDIQADGSWSTDVS